MSAPAQTSAEPKPKLEIGCTDPGVRFCLDHRLERSRCRSVRGPLRPLLRAPAVDRTVLPRSVRSRLPFARLHATAVGAADHNDFYDIMLNIESMPGLIEDVHVVPLGHEVDRALAPLGRHRPSRVYLLTLIENDRYDPDLHAKQRMYTERVASALEALAIEVVPLQTDLFDLLDVIIVTAGVIVAEQALGNRVSVNMSAAGRLTSVGATLAGMAHGAQVYYVGANRYTETEGERQMHGLSICEDSGIAPFTNFRFRLPGAASMALLVELCRHPGGRDTRHLRRVLRESGVPGFETDAGALPHDRDHPSRRSEETRQLMTLEKRYMARLIADGHVDRERQGRRNRYTITESGRYAAAISGLLWDRDRSMQSQHT